MTTATIETDLHVVHVSRGPSTCSRRGSTWLDGRWVRPRIERCLAELAGHPDRRAVRLRVALPPARSTPASRPRVAADMQVSVRRFCSERMRLDTGARWCGDRPGRSPCVRDRVAGDAGRALDHGGRDAVGDIGRRAGVIDIIGWVLAWVGLWYPFDKVLFYPLDGMREPALLALLRDAEIVAVPLIDERPSWMVADPRRVPARRRGLALRTRSPTTRPRRRASRKCVT